MLVVLRVAGAAVAWRTAAVMRTETEETTPAEVVRARSKARGMQVAQDGALEEGESVICVRNAACSW